MLRGPMATEQRGRTVVLNYNFTLKRVAEVMGWRNFVGRIHLEYARWYEEDDEMEERGRK